jgi:hypothetical protein
MSMASPDDPVIILPISGGDLVLVKATSDGSSFVASIRDGVSGWSSTPEGSLETLATALERVADLCRRRARGR